MRARTRHALGGGTLALLLAGVPAVGAPAAPAGTLRVAVLQPVSGDFAAHNRLIANGARVAAAQINRGGGIAKRWRIRLVTVPLRASAPPAAVAGRIQAARAPVAVLPCNVDPASRLARAAAARGILTLAPCNPDPAGLRGVALSWPVGMAGNQQAAQLANFAALQNGTSAVVLGARRSPYVQALSGYLAEAARRRGIRVLGRESVRLDAADVGAVAARIKAKAPRVILTAIFSPHVQRIVAELRERGVRVPVYVTDGMDAKLSLARYGAALEDVIFASFGFPRAAGEPFAREYRRRFGQAPEGSFPGLGFETVRVLKLAAERAGSVAPRRIDAALARGLAVTGVALGDVRYPGGGVHEPVRGVGLARVVRGAYVPLVASVPPAAGVPPA